MNKKTSAENERSRKQLTFERYNESSERSGYDDNDDDDDALRRGVDAPRTQMMMFVAPQMVGKLLRRMEGMTTVRQGNQYIV